MPPRRKRLPAKPKNPAKGLHADLGKIVDSNAEFKTGAVLLLNSEG
jgi:hypothetical protein